MNTSEGAIGIRASYADQKATVSIYGIPVLDDGVTWKLYSEKTEEGEKPEPQYVEDPTRARHRKGKEQRNDGKHLGDLQGHL
ncbi:MAG: hypothetical protein V8S98_00495 [Lachnospiraceae bacterium]